MNRLEAHRETGMMEPGNWERQCVQQEDVGTAQRMLSPPVSAWGRLENDSPRAPRMISLIFINQQLALTCIYRPIPPLLGPRLAELPLPCPTWEVHGPLWKSSSGNDLSGFSMKSV